MKPGTPVAPARAAGAILLFIAGCGKAPSPPPKAPAPAAATPAAHATPPAHADRSVVDLFANSCAACHGDAAKGDGPNAPLLDPRPRDFTTQALRFAATGGTKDQARAAVERTITRGLPHSGMPGFQAVLSTGEIASLADLVLARGGDLNKFAAPGTELAVPTPPELSPGLVERGKAVYITNTCTTCHGPQGQANGAGAPGLTDMEGNPIRPADLSSPLHKSGTTPRDLYRTVLMGVPGTPMAAYKQMVAPTLPGGAVNDRDAWALVALIESFSPPTPPLPEPTIRAAAAAGDLSSPDAPEWFDIRPMRVMLHSTVSTPGAPASIEVRAVRAAGKVLVRLSGDGVPLEGAEIVTAPRDRAGAPLIARDQAVPDGYRKFAASAQGAGAAVVPVDAPDSGGATVLDVVLGSGDGSLFTGWVALGTP